MSGTGNCSNNMRAFAIRCLAFLAIAMLLPVNTGMVAAQDNVFMIPGQSRSKLSGKVESVTPFKVVVSSGGRSEEVAPGLVRKIEFEGEPRNLDRARDQLNEGQYGNCIAELQKITDAPASDLIRQELEFLNAYATAQMALAGGGGSAMDAGTAMSGFVRNNPNSFHLFPAKEVLGRLFLAVDRLDLAETEFQQLTESNWPEYVVKGHYLLGRVQILQNKLEEARANLSAIEGVAGNDDGSRTMKLVAQSQIAVTDALGGNTDAAVATLKEIIRNEDASNNMLFASVYNALGATYEKAGEPKRARDAYLHTALLFQADQELHAEALFRLANLWPTLGFPDRANKARTLLLSKYPNSYWAAKF